MRPEARGNPGQVRLETASMQPNRSTHGARTSAIHPCSGGEGLFYNKKRCEGGLAKNVEKDDEKRWKKSLSESSKKWRYGVIFEWKRLIFLHTECDFFFVCLIDFYRPFKSGTHTRFLSTQNPEESAISSDLSKKQKDFLLHPSLFRGRGVVLQ